MELTADPAACDTLASAIRASIDDAMRDARGAQAQAYLALVAASTALGISATILHQHLATRRARTRPEDIADLLVENHLRPLALLNLTAMRLTDPHLPPLKIAAPAAA